LNKSSSTPTIVGSDKNEQYHPLVKTMAQADEVRLISESSMSIKDLKGFSKGGRVPTSASPGDVRYVVQLAKNDLDADLEEKFGSLRSAFGLKRKQLDVSEPDEGVGVITTPNFVYEVTLGLDEQQPGKAIWRRCVVGLSDPQVFASDAFTEVFGGEFSILEVAVPGGLDVESISSLQPRRNITGGFDRSVCRSANPVSAIPGVGLACRPPTRRHDAVAASHFWRCRVIGY